nr:alkylmercury lyase family protein [Nocardia arizonensis]
MCAVDALGIAAMLDTDVLIESVDPSTGEPITVTVRDAVVAAQPQTTVVFVGARATAGPSADTCCGYLNFFSDRQTAQNWADTHPTARWDHPGPHRRPAAGHPHLREPTARLTALPTIGVGSRGPDPILLQGHNSPPTPAGEPPVPSAQ